MNNERPKLTVTGVGDHLTTTAHRVEYLYMNRCIHMKRFIVTDHDKDMLHVIRDLQDEIARLTGTSLTARPGEPFWTLVGRDPLAVDLMMEWAYDRALVDPEDPAIVATIDKATQMGAYKRANPRHGLAVSRLQQTQASLNAKAERLAALARQHGFDLQYQVVTKANVRKRSYETNPTGN